MALKQSCIMAGMIPRELMKGDDQRRRVYSTNGLCPTLLTPTGGYFETKIVVCSETNAYNEKEK